MPASAVFSFVCMRLVVVVYGGKAAFAHTRQEGWCSGFIQINLEALSWGAYCIYLAAALRYRSDRQAGEAKQHAQIAQTRVTLSGPPNDPQRQHCIPVDLRLIRRFTHSFFRAESWAFGNTQHLGKSISNRSTWQETPLADCEDRTEAELLSTFAPCVDAGISSDLFNARTKHTQTHFSACLL